MRPSRVRSGKPQRKASRGKENQVKDTRHARGQALAAARKPTGWQLWDGWRVGMVVMGDGVRDGHSILHHARTIASRA